MAIAGRRDGQGDAHSSRRMERLYLICTILAGFSLRLPLIDRFPFHQDEAIYGYWALYSRYVDPLFLAIWPDKPPLFLWLLSATFTLFGESAAAARLVSIVASTLAIAVAAALARHWWGARAGVIAAVLLALNPFAISFAPTAFTDPLLVLCGLLALYAAARGRHFWAGIWLGAAIVTKQQGLLFVPLVLGALPWTAQAEARMLGRGLLRWGGGLLLVVLPVLWWDSLRWAVAPSPWDLGARNAAGFALVPVATWPARLGEWAALAGFLLGGPAIWLLWLAGALALVAAVARSERVRATNWWPAALLAGWGVGYWMLHVVTTVQVWDRYLLPLVIPVTLFAAFTADRLLALIPAEQGLGESSPQPLRPALHTVPIIQRQSPRLLLAILAGVLLVVLAGPAVRAAEGRLPVGGDHGAYEGLDEVADWFDARADSAPVLYHRTLGWHFRFYLFHPVEAGQIDLRWYPSDVYLADNAAKTPHRPRYLVAADWAPERNLATSLATRNLALHERLRAGNFVIYEIAERQAKVAPWRVCRAPRVSDASDATPWPRLVLDAATMQCQADGTPSTAGAGQP